MNEEYMKVEMLNELLKQATPINPFIDSYDEIDDTYVITHVLCSSCGFEIKNSDDIWECNYCPKCGQRLNWDFSNYSE